MYRVLLDTWYIIFQKNKNNNSQLFVDWEGLNNDVVHWPCFLSAENDFDRGLRLRAYDIFKGIPRQFHPNLLLDVSQCLFFLRVETGVAAILAELSTLSGQISPYESALCILTVAINSNLGLTVLYNEIPRPPNDSSVYNVAMLICGFLNWMSLSTEIVGLHKIFQTYIRNVFTFSWKTQSLLIKKKTEVTTRYRRKFSFLG